MGVSKVILNDETLMDVTDTTVDEDNLLSGETALGADGETVRGNVVVPTKTSDLTNDSGFITSSDIPVTSVNTKTGAVSLSASDVGALPDSTDVTKWNGKALIVSSGWKGGNGGGVPYFDELSSINAGLKKASTSPIADAIAVWDSNRYLYSTTPSASDNSTKVATTAYVDSAISSVDALPSQTGQSGKYLTTDGTDASWASVTVPTKTSDLTNDSGFITGYTETDPTVPSWAKQSSKPTYTATEVGALPSTTVIPSKTSDLTNDSGFITGYTETDPTVPSWAKQPSKPTYTATEVGALPNTTTIPTYTSQLVNNSGFLTSESDPTVPSWAKQPSKPSYTATEVGALPNTTTIPAYTSQLVNNSGFITASDLSCKSVPFRDKKIVYLNGINSSTYANNGWALIIWTSGQGAAYTQAGGVVMWNAATPAYCNFGSSSFNYVGYASNYSRVQITLNASYNCHGIVITSGGTDVTFA